VYVSVENTFKQSIYRQNEQNWPPYTWCYYHFASQLLIEFRANKAWVNLIFCVFSVPFDYQQYTADIPNIKHSGTQTVFVIV
jgi:hypothetical protein